MMPVKQIRFALLLTLLFVLMALNTTNATAAGGYLHTDGNKIYDVNGQEVAFSGVNWFGFETHNMVVHGLWSRNWRAMLEQIKSLGYNSIRLPFCNQMLDADAVPNSIDFHENPDLEGLSALAVMDRIIAGAGELGLKIILDNHRSEAGASAQENGLWYTDEYSEARWIEDWEMLAERYMDDDTVVAMDLRNEPHGSACWGCGDPALDWRLAAEKAGNAILAINPALLILVEGIECYGPGGTSNPGAGAECTWWGGNLMGAGDYPIRLNVAGRLVYSPHDYPATVYRQTWFDDPDYPDNLPDVWHRFWGYLHADNVAPVLIGELGTRYETRSDQQWFEKLIDYIGQNELDWTYWCWNPNSGDTGGILNDDWISVHPEKQALLETIQYPFIGSGDPQPGPDPQPNPDPDPDPQPNPDPDPDPGPNPDSNPDQDPTPRPDEDEDSDDIGCMISTMMAKRPQLF